MVNRSRGKVAGAVGTVVAIAGCLAQPGSNPPAIVADCIQQYRPATPDPMPAGANSARFSQDVTYAPPCPALAPAGEQRWSAIVVDKDDQTLRIYFIGGLPDERCDLLRSVSVDEQESTVTVRLEAGADPGISPQAACSAVGHNYVTQIHLSKPLAKRIIQGPNNSGEIEHTQHFSRSRTPE